MLSETIKIAEDIVGSSNNCGLPIGLLDKQLFPSSVYDKHVSHGEGYTVTVR